jgi:hypothetical protein
MSGYPFKCSDLNLDAVELTQAVFLIDEGNVSVTINEAYEVEAQRDPYSIEALKAQNNPKTNQQIYFCVEQFFVEQIETSLCSICKKISPANEKLQNVHSQTL